MAANTCNHVLKLSLVNKSIYLSVDSEPKISTLNIIFNHLTPWASLEFHCLLILKIYFSFFEGLIENFRISSYFTLFLGDCCCLFFWSTSDMVGDQFFSSKVFKHWCGRPSEAKKYLLPLLLGFNLYFFFFAHLPILSSLCLLVSVVMLTNSKKPFQKICMSFSFKFFQLTWWTCCQNTNKNSTGKIGIF